MNERKYSKEIINLHLDPENFNAFCCSHFYSLIVSATVLDFKLNRSHDFEIVVCINIQICIFDKKSLNLIIPNILENFKFTIVFQPFEMFVGISCYYYFYYFLN